MTFAFFLAYVVLSYVYPGEIVPALAPYRVTYWVGLAGLTVAIASLFTKRTGLVANIQLWGLALFTAVMCLSLTIAEHWMGAPIMTLQRFGPSLTTFVLALCGVTSFARLRLAAGLVIVLTTALVLQGAAACHLGLNSHLFLLDRAGIALAMSGDPDTPIETAVVDDVEAQATDTQADRSPRSPKTTKRPTSSASARSASCTTPTISALGIVVAFGLTLGLMGGIWTPARNWRHLLLAGAAVAMVYGIHLTRLTRWRGGDGHRVVEVRLPSRRRLAGARRVGDAGAGRDGAGLRRAGVVDRSG